MCVCVCVWVDLMSIVINLHFVIIYFDFYCFAHFVALLLLVHFDCCCCCCSFCFCFSWCCCCCCCWSTFRFLTRKCRPINCETLEQKLNSNSKQKQKKNKLNLCVEVCGVCVCVRNCRMWHDCALDFRTLTHTHKHTRKELRVFLTSNLIGGWGRQALFRGEAVGTGWGVVRYGGLCYDAAAATAAAQLHSYNPQIVYGTRRLSACTSARCERRQLSELRAGAVLHF